MLFQHGVRKEKKKKLKKHKINGSSHKGKAASLQLLRSSLCSNICHFFLYKISETVQDLHSHNRAFISTHSIRNIATSYTHTFPCAASSHWSLPWALYQDNFPAYVTSPLHRSCWLLLLPRTTAASLNCPLSAIRRLYLPTCFHLLKIYLLPLTTRYILFHDAYENRRQAVDVLNPCPLCCPTQAYFFVHISCHLTLQAALTLVLGSVPCLKLPGTTIIENICNNNKLFKRVYC